MENFDWWNIKRMLTYQEATKERDPEWLINHIV